jgi:hypothetical protein
MVFGESGPLMAGAMKAVLGVNRVAGLRCLPMKEWVHPVGFNEEGWAQHKLGGTGL